MPAGGLLTSGPRRFIRRRCASQSKNSERRPVMRYSPRVERLTGKGASAWEIHFAAVQAKRAGKDVIVLSLGDPDFSTPAPIVDTAIAALRAGDTHYTDIPGRMALRAAIARDHYRTRRGGGRPAERHRALRCAERALLRLALPVLAGRRGARARADVRDLRRLDQRVGREPRRRAAAAGERFSPRPRRRSSAPSHRGRAPSCSPRRTTPRASFSARRSLPASPTSHGGTTSG